MQNLAHDVALKALPDIFAHEPEAHGASLPLAAIHLTPCPILPFFAYPDAGRRDTGEAAGPVGMEDDGVEVLLKGVVALEEGKPGDAVVPLREATGRLAERFEPGYYLGLALYGTHDLAGAETQFREAARRSPSWAAAHNELGAVLFERGDKPGACTLTLRSCQGCHG